MAASELETTSAPPISTGSALTQLLTHNGGENLLKVAARGAHRQIQIIADREDGYNISFGRKVFRQHIPEALVAQIQSALKESEGFPLLDDDVWLSRVRYIAMVSADKAANVAFRIYLSPATFQVDSVTHEEEPAAAAPITEPPAGPSRTSVNREPRNPTETPSPPSAVAAAPGDSDHPIDVAEFVVALVVDAHGGDNHTLTLDCPRNQDAEITVGAEPAEEKVPLVHVSAILRELRRLCGMESNSFGEATGSVTNQNEEPTGGEADYNFELKLHETDTGIFVEIYVTSLR